MTTAAQTSDRRLLVAALLAAVGVTAIYSTVHTSIVLLGPTEVVTPFDGAVGFVVTVVGTWLSAALWYVPYLFVVLRFLGEPSQKNLVGGAVVIYLVGLLFTWLGGQVLGAETTAAAAVRPLGNVATYLAVVTVVWLAYHGGVERLTDALDTAHPVTAIGAETRLTPDLPLQHGVLAAVAAGLLGALGLALTGVLYEQVQAAAAGPSGVVLASVGVPPERIPFEAGFQAVFLLSVLLVTGPRLSRRWVATAAGVVLAGQTAVAVVWGLVVADTELLAVGGPLLRPVAGASTLLALAVAVWLAFHDGVERLGERGPLR